MLDLYKLHIFTIVVREGSFSAGAQRLLMTQSAVSQHIQTLEAELGTALFERRPRGVALTPAGVTLHEYALALLKLAAEAENAVTDLNHLTGGQVAIGASPGVSIYLLPEWIGSFRARYPNLTVSLKTDTTPGITAALLSHHLDLGIVEGEIAADAHSALESVPLQSYEQFVVVGPKHPWWTRGWVPIADLHDQTFITRQARSQSRIWLEQALQQHDIRPRIGAEFDNLESIKRAVMAGTCVTILPAYTIEQEVTLSLLRRLPIKDAPLVRTLRLVRNRDRFLSPVARAFVRHLSSQCPALEAVLD